MRASAPCRRAFACRTLTHAFVTATVNDSTGCSCSAHLHCLARRSSLHRSAAGDQGAREKEEGHGSEETCNGAAHEGRDRCGLSHIMDSGPILVIVERETPDAAHTHHVGEDTYCPHARAAHTWPCRPGQCGHGLAPHAAWLVSPSGRSPSCPVPPLAVRRAMRPRLLWEPVPAHGRLAPRPAPRGEPAGSGG